MNRKFICDFLGCNRVFNQINHLKQHKERLHYAKDTIKLITNKVSNFEDVDFDSLECDGSEEEILNFTLPPIILNNQTLENSIMDININININNPDFFHGDKPISIYYNFQKEWLEKLSYNKNILYMEINSLKEYHDAINDPTIFETILMKNVGYIKLYDLNLSESEGQRVLEIMNFYKPSVQPPSQWRTVTNFMK